VTGTSSGARRKKSDFARPRRSSSSSTTRGCTTATCSLFDNGAIPKIEPYTRPIVLKLDVKQARHGGQVVPPLRSSPFEGNLQLLSDGGALVGWGGVRKVTEFTPSAKVRFELKLPFGDTYRAFRLPWSGHPAGKPAIAVVGDRVYASWNGNTDVARWDVLAGTERSTEPDRRFGPGRGPRRWCSRDAAGRCRRAGARRLGDTLGTSDTITPLGNRLPCSACAGRSSPEQPRRRGRRDRRDCDRLAGHPEPRATDPAARKAFAAIRRRRRPDAAARA
jgi:hypothetical protein